jgi:cell division protein FtsB
VLPLRLNRRRWRRRALVLVPAAAALAYFTFHAVYGQAGYVAWVELRAEVARAEAELNEVRARNQALEAAIAGLRPASPDPDAIESALRDLGYVRPDELVVIERAD